MKAGLKHAVRDLEAHVEGRERTGKTSHTLPAVKP
jgi:hypothetical protein